MNGGRREDGARATGASSLVWSIDNGLSSVDRIVEVADS